MPRKTLVVALAIAGLMLGGHTPSDARARSAGKTTSKTATALGSTQLTPRQAAVRFTGLSPNLNPLPQGTIMEKEKALFPGTPLGMIFGLFSGH